jgi:pimeloyl-ACP methyl ester carboxylesterase
MENLVLTLPDGETVTGLINLPQSTTTAARNRPLLVCLHGGTYSSTYFDAPGQSIHTVSDALQLPVVAIDRAGYRGSSMFNNNGNVPEGSSYQEEEGKWLHEQVLPALWGTYAKPHELTCLVILTHSIGTPPAIVAVSTQCVEFEKGQEKKYNIGGLIMSGWGFTPPPLSNKVEVEKTTVSKPSRFNFPPEEKNILMLGREEDGLCDAEVYRVNGTLGTDMAFDEIDHGKNMWFKKAQRYTEQVRVPILHVLGQNDLLWSPTAQNPDACQVSFPKSLKVEEGVMLNAPHCIELSLQGKAWYVKAFGFALECAGAYQNNTLESK